MAPTVRELENVGELLDGSGAIAARYECDPFGHTVVSTAPTGDPYAWNNRYRFSTKPLDVVDKSQTESAPLSGWGGLYYYGYRYYSPGMGRWINRDPIGERGGVNLYEMVGNNAVNFWDYLGLEIKTYETQDEAAQAGSDAAWQLGQDDGNEYCGWVVKMCGDGEEGGSQSFEYFHTDPVNDIESHDKYKNGAEKARAQGWSEERINQRIQKDKKSTCYAGEKPEGAVAQYHSHGKTKDPTSEDFSYDDLDAFDAAEVDGYVATPDGAFGKYNQGETPADRGPGDERFDNVEYFDPSSGEWKPRSTGSNGYPNNPQVFR